MGADFDYASEFARLDVDALKQDLMTLMTSSQPVVAGGLRTLRAAVHPDELARRGHLPDRGRPRGWRQRRPAFRAAEQLAGQREPRQGPPAALADQQKYGRAISWADPLVFAGNCAYESMGLPTFGFGFGREDVGEPEEIFWGPEDTWLGDERYAGDRELSGPLGAVQMGLIYVNPEGPNGHPDPLASARDIRETFARMAMNDEETVALIVGGHTVGKAHGAVDPPPIGPEPEGRADRAAGLRLAQLPDRKWVPTR